jgi:hypothetical protein
MYMDAVYVLDRLGMEPGMSVTRAITHLNMLLADSSDPHTMTNKIIVSLGAKPVGNTKQAEVIAKALIEQAIMKGEYYEPEAAMAIAGAKLLKIEQTMPYVFASDDDRQTASGETRPPKGGNDKKAAAHVIFLREAGKTKGEIATIIAKEIDITYANAYYYVSRVFGK